jgi:hypothetical protein
MRKLIVTAVVGALLAGGGAFMAANASGPGPNGNNTYGLCKAYGSGSGTGTAEKQANGAAFVALEQAAAAYDEAQDMNVPPESANDPNGDSQSEEVNDYCGQFGQQP